jgi:hypothetical protein
LPTHATEQYVSACRYLATLLEALIYGEDRDEILSADWKPLKRLNDIKPLHPLIQEIAQGSFRQKQPLAIQGSGWVVKSLEYRCGHFTMPPVLMRLSCVPLTLVMTPIQPGPSAGSWPGRIGASLAYRNRCERDWHGWIYWSRR